MKTINKFILLILTLFLFSSWGCARNITSKLSAGNQISFNVTFNGTVDTSSNTDKRYYLVFSSVTPTLLNVGDYFFAPGENYSVAKLNSTGKTLDNYYQYFATWSDFVRLNNETFYLANGPFSSSANHASYEVESLSERIVSAGLEKKIILNFYLSELSISPTILYFNIVSVDSNSKIADLLSGSHYISTVAGSVISTTNDLAGDTALGELDILSYSVVVQ